MVAGVPRRRSGHTTVVTIGPERFYLTANQCDDGSLGEVFIHWGKHGSSGAGLASSYAIALSVGLRHQVPLAELIRPGLGQSFLPNGPTNDPEIPRARSAVDYIARRLAIDWLPHPDRAALGVRTLGEQGGCRLTGYGRSGSARFTGRRRVAAPAG
jgi:ribonucleoside-diphosphate reductase alpha chain